jgi:hypothetical protein
LLWLLYLPFSFVAFTTCILWDSESASVGVGVGVGVCVCERERERGGEKVFQVVVWFLITFYCVLKQKDKDPSVRLNMRQATDLVFRVFKYLKQEAENSGPAHHVANSP